MRVVIDAEFDSLTPTKIWCIVCKDIDTLKRYVFRFDKKGWENEFEIFSKGVTQWIGLNNLSFDNIHINYLLGKGTLLSNDLSLDLLIVSRLIWYSRPNPKGCTDGPHSVMAWGIRFGMEKPEIKVYDDPNMIDEYVNRCEHDVEITHRIYLELLRYIDNPEFKRAIDIEHKMQLINIDMNENGFSFDIEVAKE